MDYQYQAIVLDKRDIGEYDRLYTLFTKETGVLTIAAKGVRKPTAKLAGHLETLVRAHVSVAKRKGPGRIIGSIAEEYYPLLRSDYDTLAQVYWTVRLFRSFVGFEDPNDELFTLLEEYLSCVNSLCANPDDKTKLQQVKLVSLATAYKFFMLEGYQFDTALSAQSGEPLSDFDVIYFSPNHGGFLSGEEARQNGQSVRTSKNSIKLLRLFETNSLKSLAKVRVSDPDLGNLQSIVETFARWAGE